MISKKSTISNELLIQPHRGGVKLIVPTKYSKSQLGYSVGNLLNQPMSFYLLDQNGTTQKINEEGVEACGYDSVYQSIGKSILAVGVKDSALQLIQNCNEVMTEKVIRIFEEEHIRKDGKQYQFLSVKSPWYDDNDKIKGICGFSIVLGKHALARDRKSVV